LTHQYLKAYLRYVKFSTFWYCGIRRSEASLAAVFSGMMPLTALALSVLLLGEKPGWQQWAGGGLVVAGMLLSGRGK
jgi:drug/metabolite transporter (DMT)-like permease